AADPERRRRAHERCTQRLEDSLPGTVYTPHPEKNGSEMEDSFMKYILGALIGTGASWRRSSPHRDSYPQAGRPRCATAQRRLAALPDSPFRSKESGKEYKGGVQEMRHGGSRDTSIRPIYTLKDHEPIRTVIKMFAGTNQEVAHVRRNQTTLSLVGVSVSGII